MGTLIEDCSPGRDHSNISTDWDLSKLQGTPSPQSPRGVILASPNSEETHAICLFAGWDNPLLSHSLSKSFFLDIASKTSWTNKNVAFVCFSVWVLGSYTLMLYSKRPGHLEFLRSFLRRFLAEWPYFLGAAFGPASLCIILRPASAASSNRDWDRLPLSSLDKNASAMLALNLFAAVSQRS